MAAIRILTPADQSALEAFLLPRMASSMILIANSRKAGLVDRGEPFQGTYAAAFEHGAITGVVAHTWNGNAILQAPDHADVLCRHAVAASGRALVGLLGPAAQISAVLGALAVDSAQLRLDSVEGLFQLELAALRIPALLASAAATVRPARREDLPVIAPWRAAYAVEALNAPDTKALQETARGELERAIEEHTLWVAEQGAALVAMTGFNAVIAEAVQVGGVFTPPALRGKGYARAAVAASLLDARTRGARTSLLFTGDDNQPAQHAYRALGYERIGDYRLSFLAQPIRPDAPNS